MAAEKSDKVQTLIAKLGFDPARSPTGDGKVLASVIEEIKAEREVEVKKKVKDLLVKAMDLRKQIDEARKKFDREIAKFEKELGKVLSDLERLASGQPAPEGEEAPVEAQPAEAASPE